MHNNRYIITFVLVMTAIVALVLALMSTALKPIHDKNEAVYNKRAILAAVESDLGTKVASLSDNDVIEIFNNQITQKVFDMAGNELDKAAVEAKGYKGGLAEHIDMSKDSRKPEAERILPTYIFKSKDGKSKTIVSVRGNGLWDEIWGNVALESDLNTISGIVFDHKAETPGLGAEIKDNLAFPKAFEGKKIYDANGNYKSVDVVKGGVSNPEHQVDAISGATITTVGVGEMMIRGIKYYEPSFSKLKSN
ncbi:MAG TPA: NADH:ubiquinone reductase (Na(+)-transporting) subunit C [Saprospiraceae bacterium]|nr:NADH:ubiquinone reductase (Na(+)-transporting) subunit C [Saprospiraceae bacterium]